MVILYDVFIGLFALASYLVAPFNKKARKFVKGRNGVLSYLKKNIKPEDEIIWFHAASLGEFEQGRPVIEALKKKRPDIKILLSFFSPSGYEIRKNYKEADFVCYLPYDFSWHAKSFVNIAHPKAAYFIKYEFWHNYIHQLHKRHIPIYSISAIFRPDQVFFKWYGSWYKNLLHKFTSIFVQNKDSKKLLENIDITKVYISGDTRFDRVYDIANAVKKIDTIEEFTRNAPALIAGSTWPADEELLVQYINQFQGSHKFIIAPHEIHESGIQALIAKIKVPVARFSQACERDITNCKVLIVDNIGMLSSIYQYGTVSYIGGGFGKGIHNILEAATFGLPVIFGPNYLKFKEAVELISMKGAYSIDSFEQLKEVLDSLFQEKEQLSSASAICKNYIVTNTGATEIILEKTL